MFQTIKTQIACFEQLKFLRIDLFVKVNLNISKLNNLNSLLTKA